MGDITRNNVAGSVYGLALGDALGRDTEFMQLPHIHKAFGRSGHMRLSDPALFTDDTQMTLAVTRAMSDVNGDMQPTMFARAVGYEFIDWARYDARRAPGVTCLTAVAELQAGKDWHDATVAHSKGCGANMRVAPIAFLRDERKIAGAAQLQAAITHGHPTTLAASELTAYAVRLAAQGMHLAAIPNALLKRAKSRQSSYEDAWLGALHNRWSDTSMKMGWAECISALKRLTALLTVTDTPYDVCQYLGGAWIAEEALVVALYFAVRHADDPVLAISNAARTSGDSDSIACIAGAIVGAARGIDAWPTDWCERIERRQEIEGAIDVIWSLYNGERPPIVSSQETRVNVDKYITAPPRPKLKSRQRRRGSVSSMPLGNARNSLAADLAQFDDSALDEAWYDFSSSLTIDGEVVRRPNGKIDHSFCDHANSKNAKSRCARRNRKV